MSESEKAKNRRGLITLIGIVSILITAAAFYVIFDRIIGLAPPPVVDTGTALVEGETFDGATVLTPPREVADFTLIDSDSAPLSLSDLNGKAVLIYFGYTYCPDVCPITLGDFKRVKDELGEDAENVVFMMVSVDPKRDTAERLRQYMNNYDPEFVGLVGDETTLRQISPDYGLFYDVRDDGTETYLVDHTASTFLIDPEQRLSRIFTFATPTEVIVDNIRQVIN